MKKTLFLSLFLLSGCSAFSGADSGLEYDANEMYYEDETGLSDGTYWKEGSYVEEQTQAPTQKAPVATIRQATISADGTVIELPPQQIYIGDLNNGPIPTQPTQQPGMLSYSQPYTQTAQPNYEAKPVVVTLQNQAYPNTYAQCMSTDTNCLAGYEQQGYIRVQGLPQFAGYQDVLAPSDYPGDNRWRNNNNIPRW